MSPLSPPATSWREPIRRGQPAIFEYPAPRARSDATRCSWYPLRSTSGHVQGLRAMTLHASHRVGFVSVAIALICGGARGGPVPFFGAPVGLQLNPSEGVYASPRGV